MNLNKRCLGGDCSKESNCRAYVRPAEPNEILFRPAERGTRCHSYEPLREEDHDND